ncbi:MAG: ribonuclease Z [Thermoprotei archaeon]
MNIRIHMLGTGTAVPIKRALPCIVLRIDSSLYIFDIGEGCQQRMLKSGLSPLKVKAVFITHMHGDHYLGLFGLLQSMNLLGRKDPLYIAAPPELFEILGSIEKLKLVKLGFNYMKESISEGEIYRDEKLIVEAFRVIHSIPAYGFRILIPRRNYVIVYTGDTMPMEELIDIARNANMLIHESTFISIDREEAYRQQHSTAADAAHIAKKASVKYLVLTHISPRYGSEEVFYDAYRIYSRVTVAEDNMVIYT